VKKNHGFTLIELMIAIAIIGVLIAVAYPSYTNSLIKGNRAAARAFLLEVSQRQQQFLLDNRAYATKAELVQAGVVAPPEVSKFYEWTTTPEVIAGPPPDFTVRVTPLAGTRQAHDGWQEINSSGAKNSEKHGTAW
jgi:type IV pilus assembly protein PilE